MCHDIILYYYSAIDIDLSSSLSSYTQIKYNSGDSSNNWHKHGRMYDYFNYMFFGVEHNPKHSQRSADI